MNETAVCFAASRGLAVKALSLSLARALLAGYLLSLTGLAAAQVGTPTAEQLKLFQSLPAEQRDALIQQMGGRPTSGLGTAAGSRNGRAELVVVKSGAATTDSTGEYKRLAADVPIKGGEMLLIEVVLEDEEDTNSQAALDRQRLQQQQQLANQSGGMPQSTAATPLPQPKLKLKPEERKHAEELRDRILQRNPYVLSPDGDLQLPGFPPMPLAGLVQQEVQERLSAEPSLRNFQIGVTVLHLTLTGASALKPFGYDMFAGSSSAFVPGTDLPVPEQYKIGPGDVFDVQIYGAKQGQYSLPVGRDGIIAIPDIGPVSVAGLSYGAAANLLQSRVHSQLLGSQARISLSDLKTTRVLVLGDAQRPGSYVISALSTVTNALFASGGVKSIGSLRNIQIKRDGRVVRTLDLYDVLLNGDTASDMRLETGDVVFVPPVGATVGVDGSVRRPAIYEMRREQTLGSVVQLAGGLKPDADSRLVTVERFNDARERTVETVDLTTTAGRDFRVRTGDIVRVSAVRPVLNNAITLEGYFVRPGSYQHRPGLRLSDVITSVDDLKPRGDLHYLLIKRQSVGTRQITIFSADLSAALAHRGSEADTLLAPRDRIIAFDVDSNRDEVIRPLLLELNQQGDPTRPSSVVTVAGRVKAPGNYPLEEHMRVLDLLRAGGGMQDAAYSNSAELTRYTVEENGEKRVSSLGQVDLGAALHGDETANPELQPYDVLTVKGVPEWGRVEEVELIGEVRFPGKYRIRPGETLSSVMQRAGGLTAQAFADGAVFTREGLRKKEREQLDQLALRMQADIATLSLQNSQTNPAATSAISAGQGLLDQLRLAKPVGRLVVDMNAILAGKLAFADVTLRDGDKLVVPRMTQEVSVLGEVQSPTSHLYRPGATRDDMIAASGGVTSRADRSQIYVVRANGSVIGSPRGWTAAKNVDVKPGDSVIVPLDAERMRPLPLWTSVTTIIYNLAVAAAAIGRF